MIKAIVTDIEGTTSSIEFVAEVLFPFARKHIGDYVRQHQHNGEVTALLEEAAAMAQIPYDLEAVIDQLIQWIDQDIKATPLKTLQGLIWQQGYASGELKGHVYDDAASWLQQWHKQHRLAIYSSGSVQAQQLLFRHSVAGDLTPYLCAYFDTKIGQKRDEKSYHAIAEQLELACNEILFLSDVWQELAAAKHTGMNVIGLTRGVQEHPTSFTWVNNFDQVNCLIN